MDSRTKNEFGHWLFDICESLGMCMRICMCMYMCMCMCVCVHGHFLRSPGDSFTDPISHKSIRVESSPCDVVLCENFPGISDYVHTKKKRVVSLISTFSSSRQKSLRTHTLRENSLAFGTRLLIGPVFRNFPENIWFLIGSLVTFLLMFILPR